MTQGRRQRGWLLVLAGGAVVYVACWAATITLGVSRVVASLGAVGPSRVVANSPFPFVVDVQVHSAGSRFSARHVWLGPVTHEVSREGTLPPFIYTLF